MLTITFELAGINSPALRLNFRFPFKMSPEEYFVLISNPIFPVREKEEITIATIKIAKKIKIKEKSLVETLGLDFPK